MRIAQFGLGRWGQNHNRILTELGHTVDVYEVDQMGSTCTVMGHERFDAVVVTASSVSHWPIAKAAMLNKIPVFCEKPALTKPEQLSDMKHFCDSRSIYMSGHQLCFDPIIEQWRELCEDETFLSLTTMRTGAIPRDEGAVLSLAVHDIAVAYYLYGPAGEFEIVEARGDKHNAKVILRWGESNVDILVQSFANIRLRDMSLSHGQGAERITLDNWSRVDLLKLELTEFCSAVSEWRQPDRNTIQDTYKVMKTAFDILEVINGRSSPISDS